MAILSSLERRERRQKTSCKMLLMTVVYSCFILKETFLKCLMISVFRTEKRETETEDEERFCLMKF